MANEAAVEGVRRSTEHPSLGEIQLPDQITASLDPLQWAAYRILLRATTPVRLPRFKGSTLRGAFGSAFRELACSQRGAECSACTLGSVCAFAYVFATGRVPGAERFQSLESVPRPFLFEPPPGEAVTYQPGQTFEFGLTLFGRGVDYLPYFIVSFKELAEKGLGVGRGRARLERIEADGRLVYDAADGLVRRNWQQLNPSAALTRVRARLGGNLPAERVRLRFETPTRLKHDGHLIERPAFSVLVRALLRRISTLAALHAGHELKLDYRALIDKAEAVRLDRDATAWVDWERYSARQDARMKLGGIVGEVEYAGDLAPFVPLLAVGEWTHVGKNVTFGLGKFTVVAGG